MPASPTAPDLIIAARWIAPVAPPGVVLEDHSLVLGGGRILAVVPSAVAARDHPAIPRVERPGHLLIPGFINAHTHAAMSVLRGVADDLPLEQWLHHHIFPLENALVGPRMVEDGVRLAMAEMLRGGTTCFNDMYFFPEVVAHEAERAGMRCCVGLIMLDHATAWAANPDEYLSRGLALYDDLRHSERVRAMFAPHAPYTVSDEPLQRIRVLAEQLGLPVHMHVHETAAEVSQSQARLGVRPLERLARLGLLSPQLLAVHMTQLLAPEIKTVAAQGVHVIHCPESNLKLGSGVCPVPQLLDSGVNVALGTDGAASNNDLDMIGEMRTAALLAKGLSGDAAALDAATTLHLATLGGARALGLDAVTGSLEPGKDADITAVDLSAAATQPVYHPVAQLVYCASRDQVSDVWVRGRPLLCERRLTTLDEDAILAQARHWRRQVQKTLAARGTS